MRAFSGVYHTPVFNVACLLADSSIGVGLLSWQSSCLVLAVALAPPPPPPPPRHQSRLPFSRRSPLLLPLLPLHPLLLPVHPPPIRPQPPPPPLVLSPLFLLTALLLLPLPLPPLLPLLPLPSPL